MQCSKLHNRETKDFTDHEKEIIKHLDASLDLYKKHPVLRFLMTGAGKGGPVSNNEFRSWAENILNSSMDDVTLTDAQWVHAQTKGILDATKRKVFEKDASIREMAIKIATLPADLYNYHGAGRIHERFSEIDQLRESRRSTLGKSINKLRTHMHSLIGSSLVEGENVMAEVNELVETTGARYKLMLDKRNNGQTVNSAQLETARMDFARAEKIYDERTSYLSSTAGPAEKALRLVAEYLNGDFSYENNPEKALRTLRNRLGKTIDRAAVDRVVDSARELTDHFGGLMKESAEKMQQSLQFDLERRFPADEAERLSKQITFFEEVPEYYPNKNLISLYQRVDGMLKAKKIMQGQSGDVVQMMNQLAKSQMSMHAISRKGKSKMIDKNMIRVLDLYGQEVYNHAHAAEIAHIGSKFARDLVEVVGVKKIAGNPDHADVKYANSVRRLIMAHTNQMLEQRVSTLADDALGTISAFQVFSKLTNLSTTVNNRLEGIVQMVSNSGFLNYNRLKSLNSTYGNDIAEAMKEAHTDFVVSDLENPNMSPANNAGVRKMLSEQDLADSDALNEMAARGAVAKANDLMRKVGGKGLQLVGWEKAENANRREAFELGAAEAAHFVNTKWKDRFDRGEWTEYLVDNYDLPRGLVAEAKKNREKRSELFKKFRNKYIIRQGFRSMHQSQFQYSSSARNFMDLNPKTSWITMFQHYPRSLTSAIMWAMHDVKNLYDVAGIKGLKGEITSKKLDLDSNSGLFKLKEKTSINHRLNHVLTLGGISVLRNLLRGSTGVVAFNMLSLPFTDIMSDLFNYWVDDEPAGKRDKAWELLYGRSQPVRQFLGPTAQDVLDISSIPVQKFLSAMDGVGMALLEDGIKDGSLVQHLSDTLGATGLKPNEPALTDRGRKNYNSAMMVAKEHTLNSFSMYNKGQDLVNALITKEPKEITYQMARMAGIKFDWKVVKKGREEKEYRP